ncbi:MAG TPA: ASCH domain-containing protein [Archaeoglobaceae archaeon]|nr:ASCH domain-containing protein [Archaeoglobaceae archaeon]
MEKINFDSEYVKPILQRGKRTTIRKGIKKYSGNVLLTSDGSVFAEAKIKKVVVKRVKELTDEDARTDGFGNLEELLSALKRIYGNLDENEFVTIVYFEIPD